MKNLVVALVILTTTMGFSQRGGHQEHRRQIKADLTVEQMATLQSKKMALALDLNDKQLEQVQVIHLENAKLKKQKMAERKAKKEEGTFKKPTAEEVFERQNAMLDRKLAIQAQMKDILSDEQYAQWKKLNLMRHMQGKKKMQKDGRRG
ncbi:hypothetical protein [Croceivirga thetidis]|uniref:Periplasmic heavy metal sensor n=1 Tax=Croceivirga thetidis TaxID=2721623 RepID=A0ABX1GQG3_9FLAO|nr:hypothetical protein [Croceivirga thetidis]NKI31834.1 hypothetical protein [Croceivirga thetidis]